jgi:hypothetical protein
MKLNTLAEPDSLAHELDLTDSDEPMLAYPVILQPPRPVERQLPPKETSPATRQNDRTDKELDNVTQSRIDTLEPKRACCRNDNELPVLNISRIDNGFIPIIFPFTDIALPQRANDRIEIEDPKPVA